GARSNPGLRHARRELSRTKTTGKHQRKCFPLHHHYGNQRIMKKFPGTPPTGLGVSKDGRLKACANKPNCVSSQSGNKRHAIEPLSFGKDSGKAMTALKAILNETPRTVIVR